MKRVWLVILASIIVLPGCQAIRQRQFAKDDQFCKSIGASGTAYTQCMMQRDHDRQESGAYDAQRMAIYNNLANNGTIYPPPPARHTNCVQTSDITTNCTTY